MKTFPSEPAEAARVRSEIIGYHVTLAGFAAAERFRARLVAADTARAAAKAQAPARLSTVQRFALNVADRYGGVCSGSHSIGPIARVITGGTLRALVKRGLLYLMLYGDDYLLTREGHEWVCLAKRHRAR